MKLSLAMKPKLLLLCSSIVVIVLVGVSTTVMSQQQKRGLVYQEGDTPDKKPPELNPEFVFKANKGTPKSKLVDIGAKVLKDKDALAKEDAMIQKLEVTTHGEYSASIGVSASNNTQLSPERLIWVVQIHYPQGYEHPRVGVVENAQVTKIYDAETGEYLSQSIRKVD